LEQVEQQLAPTEERLRAALQSSEIGVWTWNVAQNTIEADEACAALFGLEMGQFPGTIESVLALVHEEDRARVYKEVTASAALGAKYRTEYRVMWPAGAVRTLSARGRAVVNEAGRPELLTGACWDITEDVHPAPQGLEGETSFRRLLEGAPDAMVFVNGEGKIVLVNGQVEELFGYRREELLGQPIEILIPNRFREHHPWLLAAAPTRFAAELCGLRKDGAEFEIEVNLRRVEAKEGWLVSSVIRDVSVRKRKEQQIQRVAETSDQIRADRQTARDVLQSESDVRQTARDVLQSESDERQTARDVLQSESDERQTARDVLQSESDMRQTARDVLQSESDVRQTARDVLQSESDERQTVRNERQSKNVIRLEDMVAVSEAANQAKSIFLSAMSHEIRTPLNAVLGYSQLMLRDSNLGPDAKANLKIINRSGEHLLALINDVLDMSKIEAGREEINPITFSLPRLLEDMENMFRLRADAKELSFELLVDGETLQYVVADEGKIRQVLINLLGNAIKFTKHGKVKGHVTLSREEGTKLWLSAAVEDSGPGISEDELKRLFQPFVQTRGGFNTQGGTGLGLAISRQHARLMGGDITVSERPGGGSVFLFRVPIEKGEDGVALKRTSRGRVIRLGPGQETQRILVVDDHFENQNWLVKLLSTVGFSVRGASNGAEGIRIWKEWNPKLILMDVHMPVMDGLEATRRIKADPKGAETSVLILTASALDQERQIASQSGADDFLPKPCHEDELFESIRVLMGAVFDYEVAGTDEPAVRAPAWSMKGLGRLTPESLANLREATESGNKKALNQLILEVRDGAGDAGLADGLQDLADKYEYDVLLRLLEEAAIPHG
jgi:PAS domain S-box-containing protein